MNTDTNPQHLTVESTRVYDRAKTPEEIAADYTRIRWTNPEPSDKTNDAQRAVAAEREACAQFLEAQAAKSDWLVADALASAAEAIRARGRSGE